MELFELKNNKLNSVELKPFEKEKEIQYLVEQNTQTLFQLDFIRTEFPLGNYRIDTLCFDKESNAFVIIEYKKGSSYSVIDQGYTYLQLLLNNKSDFVLTLSQHFNKVLRNEDIDWSQSKIIFISPAFTNYQKDSVNFKNLPFELWEVKRYTNNTVVFNKHRSTSQESIESLSSNTNQNIINSVNKEVKVVDEAFHVNKCVPELVQKWEELKEKLLDLPNTQLIPKSGYISLMYGNKTISFLKFGANTISIDMLRGNLAPDGKKSKNFFDIDDPKGIVKEGSWEWKSGVKGNDYRVPFTVHSDIDYLFFLIKQKYTNSIR